MWDSRRRESARQGWMPWVLPEARTLPALAMPGAWLVCPQPACLLPRGWGCEGDKAQVGRLHYRRCGMYLTIMSPRKVEGVVGWLNGLNTPSTMFGPAGGHGPDSRRGYGWE